MKTEAWMTEHDSGPMLWPTKEEALTYCDDDSEPIALGRCDDLLKRLSLYEAAVKEAEAILGGEYAMQYGPFFDLVQAARQNSRLPSSEHSDLALLRACK